MPVPADPTLQIWYDGADSTQFIPTNPASGSAITQWTDKSATAHNAAPTGGPSTRPLFATNVQNGKSAVYFDQVEDGLEAPINQLASLTASSVIWVGKTFNTSSNQQVLQGVQKSGGSYTFTNEAQLYISGSNNFVVGFASASAVSNVPVDTGWHIHTLLFDGTQIGNTNRLKYRVDGVERELTFTGNVSSSTSINANHMLFGTDADLNNDFLGYMGEVLVYTKTLVGSQLTNTESYLFNKWNTIPASPSPSPTPSFSVTPSVTPTISPSAAVDSLRAALTTSTASYDAATVGNWVKITSTEYANIKSVISGATTRGMTEAQANEVGSSWTGTCAYTFNSGSTSGSESPAGEYIIAFSARLGGSQSGVFSVMTSNSYKSGSYAVLGNSPTMNAVLGREYFVRKAPTTANAVTTYIATAASASRAMGTTTFANAAYDCTPNPYNGPWSLWTSGAPIFQFVGTSVKSW